MLLCAGVRISQSSENQSVFAKNSKQIEFVGLTHCICKDLWRMKFDLYLMIARPSKGLTTPFSISAGDDNQEFILDAR